MYVQEIYWEWLKVWPLLFASNLVKGAFLCVVILGVEVSEFVTGGGAMICI